MAVTIVLLEQGASELYMRVNCLLLFSIDSAKLFPLVHARTHT